MSGNNNATAPTQDDKARIQSTQAKSGGNMTSSGFAARAQGAADKATSGNNQQGGNNAQGQAKK